MTKDPEDPKMKKKMKFQHMDDCHMKLRDQVTNSELYEENLNLLRQIIEVIIWGDQNKMPFTAVSPLALRILHPFPPCFLWSLLPFWIWGWA